jgi:hypothetical protein
MKPPAFFVHAGMPKTATTTIQTILSSNPQLLERSESVYPPMWRDQEGIAHHDAGLRLLSQSDAVVESIIGEIRDYVHHNRTQSVILSTESLSNLLGQQRISTFVSLFQAVGSIMPVRMVLAVRRIDEFFESMYLHSVKVGEVSRSIEQYLAEREAWPQNFFDSLFFLRHTKYAARVELVPYRSGTSFVGSMLNALGIRSNDEFASVHGGLVNARLGLRAQTALLYLDRLQAEIGVPIDRPLLIRDFERGRFAFEDEIYEFSVTPVTWAKYYHERALRLSLERRLNEYYEAFRDCAIPEYRHRDMKFELLSQRNIASLREWLRSRNNQRIVAQSP